MRVHISLDERLVAQLDRLIGRRKRSAFIAETLRRALEDQRRWNDIVASLGKIGDDGHQWDDSPARWVRRQRRADSRRVG
ncbi:MAG: ribbon-helix-helix domain-containing protein [Candidatus Limnocylindria bacterium]